MDLFVNHRPKPKSGRLEQDIALMSEEEHLDRTTFLNEYEKNGPGLLVANVRHRKKEFQESFDSLVSDGCRPRLLFLGLHQLWKFAVREKACQHPGRRELRSLEASLRKTVKNVRDFEKKYLQAQRARFWGYHFCRQEQTPTDYVVFARWGEMLGYMLNYAEMLRTWRAPRSDVLKSYGAIYNCIYAQVATNSPKLSKIATLHSRFLN